MPEEINRILTDHVSALLFVPTLQGERNLKKEGIRTGVVRTGDIMYDLLQIVRAKGLLDPSAELGTYYFATIHRPYNTDDPQRLKDILGHLNVLDHPVKFPIHPRTKNLLSLQGVVLDTFENIEFLDPLGYFENIRMMRNARGIITDSGGIQKEAYWLKRKCVTLRPETEWPETLRNGWNHLVFERLEDIAPLIIQKPGRYVEALYGNGASRYEIIGAIEQYFSDDKA
jgi:UDP-GlcNAc3NAcA epimerase